MPSEPGPCADVRQSAQRSAALVAVMTSENGGDGWESNPPRTPQQRPTNSFEDCGQAVPTSPPVSARVQLGAVAIHDRPPSCAIVHRLGCLLGPVAELSASDH